MRILLAFLLALPVVALDNSVRIVERTGAAQASRPFTLFRSFANDEICGYPQPFADGGAVTPWQSDVWSRWPASALCPAGAVKTSYISFRLSLAANQAIVVEAWDNANPCSSGDAAACAAAALTQSSMLSFNGGNWGAKMTVTANPQGSSSAQNVDARAMMSAGVWSYRLRGPVVTQVVVEDRTTARSYDIGWRESWTVRPTETIYETTRTTINVEDASNWLLATAVQGSDGLRDPLDLLRHSHYVGRRDDQRNQRCVRLHCRTGRGRDHPELPSGQLSPVHPSPYGIDADRQISTRMPLPSR